MSYTPTNWVSGETPLSAENMNHIEQGIVELNSKDIKFVTHSFGSLSVNSSGAVNTTQDVSNSIPSGYSLVSVWPKNTGGYGFYFYNCGNTSGTNVQITLFRAAGSATSTSPSVILVCVK